MQPRKTNIKKIDKHVALEVHAICFEGLRQLCAELKRTPKSQFYRDINVAQVVTQSPIHSLCFIGPLRTNPSSCFRSNTISAIVSTFHDYLMKTIFLQFSRSDLAVSRLIERRSWGTCFAQEPERSDAFCVTKRASYSKTTPHTSGTQTKQ